MTALHEGGHAVLFEHLLDQHRDRVSKRAAKLDKLDIPPGLLCTISRRMIAKGRRHEAAPAAGTKVDLRPELSGADWAEHPHNACTLTALMGQLLRPLKPGPGPDLRGSGRARRAWAPGLRVEEAEAPPAVALRSPFEKLPVHSCSFSPASSRRERVEPYSMSQSMSAFIRRDHA
jgi:hypothetical protein